MFDELDKKDIEDIMYADLFFLKKRTNEEISAIEKSWLKELLHCSLDIPQCEQTSYIFFRSLVRDDYKDLFHTIINECHGSKIIVEDYRKTISEVNILASSFLLTNRHLIRKLKFVDEKYLLAITIRFIYYCFIVSSLLKNKTKVLVCFSDMQPVEHLASICFKQKGSKTVTMQHGLYIEYNELDTVNVINYKNQPSDYFLAWGEHTKSLISKYHPDTEIETCGKPNLTKFKSEEESKSLLIIFDQEIFHQQNIRMYEIVKNVAESQGFLVYVKFHPHNNIPAYEKKLGLLNKANTLHDYRFVIGHTSSLIFEFQATGSIVFQFKTDIPTIDISSQFESENDLSNLLQVAKVTELSHKDCPIKYISDVSRSKYNGFFTRLNQEVSVSDGNDPYFTVIIPSYNSALTIHKSIASLKKQSFKDFEVLIMDGNSSDVTVPFTLSCINGDGRFKLFSENDHGTYDAMNKGVSKSKGRWLYFMGSDDSFNDVDVLNDVYREIENNNDPSLGLVYGNVKVVGDVKWAKDGTIYDGLFDDEKIKKKNICHQAIFYKREYKLRLYPYNLKYRLCADWDMNLKFWATTNNKYLDRTIAKFYAGGQSTDGSDPEFGKDFKNNVNKYFNAPLMTS